MRDMRSNNNVVYVCRYRVVFCPKYRRKVLTPPVDERLKVLLAEQIERWGQDLIEMEVLPDHVHLLVGCDPPVGIHRRVKRLKGYIQVAYAARGVPRTQASPAVAVDQPLVCEHRGRRHAGNAEAVVENQKGK